MKFKDRIKKGRSYYITIPAGQAKLEGLKTGDIVNIELKKRG